MIDLEDYIVKRVARKSPRFLGEVTSSKYFHCFCDRCGRDRGYISKSRYLRSTLCKRCRLSSDETRQKMKRNHWSKRGTYSPQRFVTESQKKERYERRLQQNRRYYKQYYQVNKERIAAKRRLYQESNVNVKLASRLRSRLYLAVRNHYRAGSAVRDLGCSIEQLKQYLQRQFQPGMTWDNYGQWHIDHVVPLSAFDLEQRHELLKACHYTNLRPLWARDNLAKNKRSP